MTPETPMISVQQDQAAPPHAWHEAHLDGLFTYCLSVLRDYDAALAALGAALAVAERRRGHAPRDPAEHRAWRYALARWACLARLAADRRTRTAPAPAPSTGSGAPTTGGSDAHAGSVATAAPVRPFDERRGLRELAALAWPEAAGTAPEQREALELTVRHGLTASEVAAVLGVASGAARELIAAAACEVERVQAAAAAVRTSGCPAVAWLGGDPQLLGALLRRRLVRHVDDCPRCRRAAERAAAPAWPGTSLLHTGLPLVVAPRTALQRAMAAAPRTRGGGPRFDRRGYPVLRVPR